MFELVVIGTSLGGLSALRIVLGGLPPDFPAAIAIVQHRHKRSESSGLCALLQQSLALPLQEVEDKDEILPGHVYLAPANYHLLVEPGYFSLSTDAPVSFACPSIDVLFESAAETYQDRVIGIILTGANHDGAYGLTCIKARRGLTLVQEPTTAESDIMPQAAIAATQIDAILPLAQISPYLVQQISHVRS